MSFPEDFTDVILQAGILMPEQHSPPSVERQVGTSESVVVTAEALRFCEKNQIVQHLQQGIMLAQSCFSIDRGMRVFLEQDPEDSDEYAVLAVDPSPDAEADLKSYFKFAEEWSAKVEWPASRMILLDLRAVVSSLTDQVRANPDSWRTAKENMVACARARGQAI